MNWFSKIHGLAGQEYERYLPTAFDGSLTLLEKVNKVIETLNQIVLGVNTVADYVEGHVETQNEKIKQLRDDFEILKDWLENEGLEERTVVVLNEWFDNGRLAQIINNDVFNMKADKALFEQFVISTTTQLHHLNRDDATTFGVTGIGDNTTAINLAAKSGGSVIYKSGVYEISDTIFFSENTHFIADGDVVFKITKDVDVFKLKRNNQLIGFKYDFTSVVPYTKDVFEISSMLLEDVEFNLEHRYNLQIKINKSEFYFANGRFNTPQGTIFNIWASKTDYLERNWKVIGFWGVDITDLYVTGWPGFVTRTWAYRTDETANTGWMTGFRFNNWTVNSAHYGIFGSRSLETMDDLRYSDVGNLYIDNFLFQNQDSKLMAFFTNGYKFVTNSIPWDWDYYTTDAPFLLQYRPAGYDAKIQFDHGYGSLSDNFEINNKPVGMTKEEELAWIGRNTYYRSVFESTTGNPKKWEVIPFTGAWTPLSGHAIRALKDNNGVVTLLFSGVPTGTAGGIMVTLPQKYRPITPVVCDSVSAMDGTITPVRFVIGASGAISATGGLVAGLGYQFQVSYHTN